MLNLEIKTGRPWDEVRREMTEFFEGGLGLERHDQSRPAMHFTGAGGFVFAYPRSSEADEDETVVEFLTREWEQPVREFAARIA